MANLSKWKVLIVEDDPDARQLLVPVLEHHQARVFTAANADEALERFRANRPNLALVDLALPGTDGWELLEMLREDPRFDQVTLIAMTTYDYPEVAEETLAAGFTAYVPKPINLRTFIDDLVKVVPLPA